MIFRRATLTAFLISSFTAATIRATDEAVASTLATEIEAADLSDLDTEIVLKHGYLRENFQEWMEKFEKEYDDVKEELKRFATWIRNHEYIHKHNTQNPPPSFTLGHNHFSDLTNDEFQKLNFLGSYFPGISTIPTPPEELVVKAEELDLLDKDNMPTEIDWVEAGAVTEVKNQGACGSCWSFSASGSIEGAKFIKDGELVSLSEQMMIDCDNTDLGCQGGLMDSAFQYTLKSGGLCSEADYPYMMVKNRCGALGCTRVEDTEVEKYYDVDPGNVDALMSALAQQPVSVAIQANQLEFQLYSGGVFNLTTCSDDLDHGVLAVGYGTDEDEDYWKVKNSWGETWGEDGYIRFSRESDLPNGVCGILAMASRPVV